jgi:hypothetical protein
MQSTYEWASITVQVGILAILGYIAWRVGQINAKTGVSFYLGKPAHFHPVAVGGHHRLGGDQIEIGISYSIWIYRGGEWVLLKRCGQTGCSCDAPADPGDYEGKVVRKECTAS